VHKLVRLAVEGGERLAVAGVADVQFPARELFQVEDVARVAELEGDEVGDVDEVVDRALADGFEEVGEPLRARAHLDAPDQACGEQRAGGRLVVDEFQVVSDRGAGLGVGELGELQLTLGVGAGGRRDLAGAAHMREQVAPVGGELDVEQKVARGEFVDALDGVAGEGEHVLGLLGGDAGGREVAVEPGKADVHGVKPRGAV